MTRELIDLRTSILEERYADALFIVDELEEMSKQAILRNIESFLLRLLIHLLKNQVEQRLTYSLVASITGSIRSIKKLNLKDNKTSYYIKADEWEPMLLEELEAAISDASREVMNGRFSRSQLSEMVDRSQLILTATELLSLTYTSSARELEEMMDAQLTQLPEGEEWDYERGGFGRSHFWSVPRSRQMII